MLLRLGDGFLGRRKADAGAPDLRQRTVQGNAGGFGRLVVSDERLLEGIQRDLQGLRRVQELREGQLGARVIANAVGGTAVQIDDGGRQIETFSTAEQIGIGPGHRTTAAQVARIGGAQRHPMPVLALGHPEGHRNRAVGVRLRSQSHIHRPEHTHCQQVAARLVQRLGTVLIAAVQLQARQHCRLTGALQTGDADGAKAHDGAGLYMKAHLELLRVGQFVGDRRVHLGEGIAEVLQRRKQAVTCIQNVCRNRRLTGMQIQLAAQGLRQVAIEGDLPQVV